MEDETRRRKPSECERAGSAQCGRDFLKSSSTGLTRDSRMPSGVAPLHARSRTFADRQSFVACARADSNLNDVISRLCSRIVSNSLRIMTQQDERHET